MPRLSADTWETIRAEREGAGLSFGVLASKHGVTGEAIRKRARAEGWSDGEDSPEAIRRLVAAKVAGLVAADPEKKAAAIEAAADQGADIIRRHREEWSEHRQLFPTVAILEDFDTGKSAKISAEMIAIRQKAERIAWDLEEQPEGSVHIQWLTT